MCIIGMLCLDIRLRLVFTFFPYVVATISMVNKDYYYHSPNCLTCICMAAWCRWVKFGCDACPKMPIYVHSYFTNSSPRVYHSIVQVKSELWPPVEIWQLQPWSYVRLDVVVFVRSFVALKAKRLIALPASSRNDQSHRPPPARRQTFIKRSTTYMTAYV